MAKRSHKCLSFGTKAEQLLCAHTAIKNNMKPKLTKEQNLLCSCPIGYVRECPVHCLLAAIQEDESLEYWRTRAVVAEAKVLEFHAQIGRLGGLATSSAKAKAARKNGKLGGRPRADGKEGGE